MVLIFILKSVVGYKYLKYLKKKKVATLSDAHS